MLQNICKSLHCSNLYFTQHPNIFWIRVTQVVRSITSFIFVQPILRGSYSILTFRMAFMLWLLGTTIVLCNNVEPASLLQIGGRCVFVCAFLSRLTFRHLKIELVADVQHAYRAFWLDYRLTFSAVEFFPPFLSHCCSPSLTLSLFLILLRSPERALSPQVQLKNSCIMPRSYMTQHFTLILVTGWTWLAECLSKCRGAWPSPASCCSSTGSSSCTSTAQTFKRVVFL